jgi:hypothetical protein
VKIQASKIGLALHKNEQVEWMTVAVATFALGAESAAVMGLRALKTANGGSQAADEMWRMYTEKLITLAELQTRFLGGSLGTTPSETTRKAVMLYRHKVAANCRRLAKR